MSIPQLELEAALASKKSSKVAARCLAVENQNMVFQSDSMNVLWWITRRNKKLTQCLGNKIAKIREETSAQQYLPTKQNPADLKVWKATVEEPQVKQWWSGPTFVQPEAEKWHAKEKVILTGEARKEVRNHAQNTTNPAISLVVIPLLIGPPK